MLKRKGDHWLDGAEDVRSDVAARARRQPQLLDAQTQSEGMDAISSTTETQWDFSQTYDLSNSTWEDDSTWPSLYNTHWVSPVDAEWQDAPAVPLAHPLNTAPEETPLQAASTALIFYGMIPDIKCQFLKGSKDATTCDPPIAPRGVDYVPLRLLIQQGKPLIGTETYPELAHMNSKAALVLLEALKYAGVQLDLYVARSHLDECLRTAKATVPTKFLYVDVHVSGRRSDSESIGALLWKHNIYLQDPRQALSCLEYCNPHIIPVDVSDVDVWFQEIALHNEKTNDATEWTAALDSLPQQHSFDATAVSIDETIVITQMMPHQGEALDFMCKREIGGALLDDSLRFWQPDRNEDALPVYRHTVTGDERHEPQRETFGGILADDMGLGKTLTTIALIVSSINRAFHFGASKSQNTPGSRATLVVVPSTQILDSWLQQFNQHTRAGRLTISKYHGHDRVRHFSELMNHDVVLTTYGTIATEFRKLRRQVLYQMLFFRIVLDEAHTIRSRRTKLFTAITTLDAVHHWCLTGTPISNKIDDLGALLDFCRVPILGDHNLFKQHVIAVSKKSFRRGCGILREVLKPLCLRRTKAILDISSPKTYEKEVEFSKYEMEHYRWIMDQGKRAIDAAVSGHTEKGSRHVMLKTLLNLRIFCNQGTYTEKGDDMDDRSLDADQHLTLLEEKEEAFCGCCFSSVALINQFTDPDSGVLGDCLHILCHICYGQTADESRSSSSYKCSVCGDLTTPRNMNRGQGSTSKSRASKHSSKLSALIQDLLLSQRALIPEKSIVFSAWKRTLNLASTLCTENEIPHLLIDGETPQSERPGLLQRFANDASISTLLMTLGTGALGLTITAASRIHILEPQWNPAVENQAIGRVVRIGQVRVPTVIRYFVKDSVEQQIRGYQQHKMKLAAGGFSRRGEEVPAHDTVRLNAAFITQNARELPVNQPHT